MSQVADRLPPHTEARRLASLRAYGILDTPQEELFDDIVRLAAAVCDAPMSVITLVDADRQWFKAELGVGVRETPLDTSICAHAILEHDFLEVPDTTQDARFASMPSVTGEMGLRFYAGALLKTPDGLPLGTMCVLDTTPRVLTPKQSDMLRALARQVMAQLELRRMLTDAVILNQQRARALASAGHDLKAPLRSALYSIGRVRSGLPADDVEPSTRLQLAEQDLALIDRKFGEMVAAATGRGGALRPMLASTEIGPVLEEVRRSWARAAALKGIALSVEATDCRARTSVALLETLLGNLVSNAIKYTPAVGSVALECHEHGDHVVITVTDTGIGMAPEHVEEYFDAFKQADPSTEGLGIGLWIVRQAADALDATVDVHSRLRHGTRVTVLLPRD